MTNSEYQARQKTEELLIEEYKSKNQSKEQQGRVCHWCEYRHWSCGNDIIAVYEKGDCDDFVLGECFNCSLHKTGDFSQCSDVFWPSRCENYKE